MRQESAQEVFGQCGFFFVYEKKRCAVFSLFFKQRQGFRHKFSGQRQKQPGFFYIAAGGSGFLTVRRIDVDTDAFVDCYIFLRQIIVVFVILIKMVQCSFIKWNGNFHPVCVKGIVDVILFCM